MYIHLYTCILPPNKKVAQKKKKKENKKNNSCFFSAPCSVQHFNVTGGTRVKKDNSTIDGY